MSTQRSQGKPSCAQTSLLGWSLGAPPGRDSVNPDLPPRRSLSAWPAYFLHGCEKFTAHKFCGATSPERLLWPAGRHLAGHRAAPFLPGTCAWSVLLPVFGHPSHRGHISVPFQATPGRLGALEQAQPVWLRRRETPAETPAVAPVRWKRRKRALGHSPASWVSSPKELLFPPPGSR